MAQLTISGLQKSFGKVPALRGIDLSIPDGEFCVFVGPSGCGTATSPWSSRTMPSTPI
jgi:ABC-type sugar transport system ATPase subunit